MLTITPLRTPRIQVEMHELAARDAIALCQMNPDLSEYGASELLKRIVAAPTDVREGQVTDFRVWTVQERAFAIAHYLAHMGEVDFRIGEAARYSDYLMATGITSPPPPVEMGELAGRRWSLQPMLGWHAESIERVIQSDELPNDRTGWLVGALATQVYDDATGALDCANMTDAVIDGAVQDRAIELMALPESDFMALVSAYYQHLPAIDHIFHLSICGDGIGFLPAREVTGSGPARFHFSLAIREDTADVFGPPARDADRTGAVPGPGPDGGGLAAGEPD